VSGHWTPGTARSATGLARSPRGWCPTPPTAPRSRSTSLSSARRLPGNRSGSCPSVRRRAEAHRDKLIQLVGLDTLFALLACGWAARSRPRPSALPLRAWNRRTLRVSSQRFSATPLRARVAGLRTCSPRRARRRRQPPRQLVAVRRAARPAVLRAQQVHDLAGDAQFAVADVLQAGGHVQQRALAGAGRPDEHDELAVGDLQVYPADSLGAVGYRLVILSSVIAAMPASSSLYRARSQADDNAALEDHDEDHDRDRDDNRGRRDRPDREGELGDAGEEAAGAARPRRSAALL
jgi:hypothetical protein